MALDTRRKDRLRGAIRVIMAAIAVLLLFFAIGIPIANNAVALGVERELKKFPLPPDTVVVESTSAASKLAGNGNGMQYFGAVLLKSELPIEQLYDHYRPYRKGLQDCLIEPQSGSEIQPRGESLIGGLSFRDPAQGEGYYLLYSWGSAPNWLQDLLDTDIRGH